MDSYTHCLHSFNKVNMAHVQTVTYNNKQLLIDIKGRTYLQI